MLFEAGCGLWGAKQEDNDEKTPPIEGREMGRDKGIRSSVASTMYDETWKWN